MLEITESGFNAPALVIHFFEFSGREGIPVQIGNQVFPDAGGDFNGNHAKIKRVIENGYSKSQKSKRTLFGRKR